jgi:peptidoglycan/LPS O-acetylase OafA/YrhL
MFRRTGSRHPGASTKLAGPDHLRALAITLVVFFHYRAFGHPAWTEPAGSFGWTGVDLFFVLSGYLISGQLFKQVAGQQNISIRDFFLKRIFRIIPAYLVVLAIYVFFEGSRERETLAPLWKFLTFTQNYGQDIARYGTFSHAWSLCVEEQFYLLLPFTFLLFVSLQWGKKAAFLIIGLFLLGFLLRLFSWYELVQPLKGTHEYGIAWYKYMYYPTYTRLDGLLAGICLAGLRQFYPAARSFIDRRGNVLLTIGLALTGLAYYICIDAHTFTASIFGFPLVALAYGCILAAAVSPSCFLYRFPLKVSSGIAALSYAIYLSHKIIIHLIQGQSDWLGMDKNSNGMFILCLAGSLSGAVLLRYAVEKPFMRWRDWLLARLRRTDKVLKWNIRHRVIPPAGKIKMPPFGRENEKTMP